MLLIVVIAQVVKRRKMKINVIGSNLDVTLLKKHHFFDIQTCFYFIFIQNTIFYKIKALVIHFFAVDTSTELPRISKPRIMREHCIDENYYFLCNLKLNLIQKPQISEGISDKLPQILNFGIFLRTANRRIRR